MRSILILLFVGLSFHSYGQDFPEKSNRLINDYAKVLTNIEVADLENLLVKYDNETSVQIAIVIMPTLDGYPVDDYAFQLGEKWGVGQGETDNGALVLVSVDERKMWIATGYGLEGVLPDAIIKRIIQNEITPQFKGRRYYHGLKAGVDAIILATKGEYANQGNGDGGSNSGAGKSIPLVFLVGGIWLIVMITKSMQVRRHARINGLGFWAAWMLLNSATRRHGGSYSSFSGGSGGFGGGGSFGGFGGGSFGGGGAGGSW